MEILIFFTLMQINEQERKKYKVDDITASC